MSPKKRLLIFSLLTAVLLAPALCPAQGLPNGVQKVTSVEGITEYSLTNGLHFLVERHHQLRSHQLFRDIQGQR